MKSLTIITVLMTLLLGCASPDPMVTGKPQDWRGRPAVDLRTAWGEPTRIIPQSNGDEVWEYRESSDRVVPKGESMSFGFGASSIGSRAGFSKENRPEDRVSQHENLARFKIRKGKIVEWYAANIVDGRTVWEDR